jgi:hypothetical protein
VWVGVCVCVRACVCVGVRVCARVCMYVYGTLLWLWLCGAGYVHVA